MGRTPEAIDPSALTASGDQCLQDIADVASVQESQTKPTEWVILSCATLVESHLNRVIKALIEQSGLKDLPLGLALLREQEDDIFRTIDSRFKWLDNGFGISVAGDREIQEYRYLVDLRNTLVHGQGKLTELQAKRFDKMLDLKRQLTRLFGASFRGREILLTLTAGLSGVHIARRAVVHLDARVMQQYPSLPV